MQTEQIAEAANLLWSTWQQGRQVDALPAAVRPRNRAEGYDIQDSVVRRSGQSVFGWKIAATSAGGQKHIGVDGPLAGRLLANRVIAEGAPAPLANNIMKVMEAEFAFRMRDDLPPRASEYTRDEVLAATADMHLAIEIPDSRYVDFATAGAPQLIADCACACWFMLGKRVTQDWRQTDLAAHRVTALLNRHEVRTGSGANVLGDPRIALTWIANELRSVGRGLRSGEVVTTGTCVIPVEVNPGDEAVADFGEFGSVAVRFA